MTHRALAPLLLLCLALSACDSSGSDIDATPTDLTGAWAGEVVSEGVAYAVTLDLTEENTFILGTGTVETPNFGVLTFDVIDGSDYLHPSVNLFLMFDREPPLGKISGNVTSGRDEIRGTMEAPGVAGIVELALQRQ